MRRTIPLLAAVMVLSALLGATAAAAAPTPSTYADEQWVRADQGGQGNEPSGDERDIVPPLLWTVAGLVGSAVVLGILYLLKRALGGFPDHPDWVAPISIERSSTFPDDTSYGDASAHASGAHH